MTRRVDIDQVQRAFDAAARDAKTGPREVRAGRFTPTKPPARPKAPKQ